MTLRWYPLVGGSLDGDEVIGTEPPQPRILLVVPEDPSLPARQWPSPECPEWGRYHAEQYELVSAGGRLVYRHIPQVVH